MNSKEIIQLIENIANFSSNGMPNHRICSQQYSRFKEAMTLAEDSGLLTEAVSYYNFKYLKDLYGNDSESMILPFKGIVGTKELSDGFQELSTMNLVKELQTKNAWGRKEILSFPVYGNRLKEEMIKLNKTSLGTKELIYLLFGLRSQDLGFTYYGEFVELMKTQKTMVNKAVARGLLRQYWDAVNVELKSNPELFIIVKNSIIAVNNTLVDSNSTQRMRVTFMEEFLKLSTN